MTRRLWASCEACGTKTNKNDSAAEAEQAAIRGVKDKFRELDRNRESRPLLPRERADEGRGKKPDTHDVNVMCGEFKAGIDISTISALSTFSWLWIDISILSTQHIAYSEVCYGTAGVIHQVLHARSMIYQTCSCTACSHTYVRRRFQSEWKNPKQSSLDSDGSLTTPHDP